MNRDEVLSKLTFFLDLAAINILASDLEARPNIPFVYKLPGNLLAACCLLFGNNLKLFYNTGRQF